MHRCVLCLYVSMSVLDTVEHDLQKIVNFHLGGCWELKLCHLEERPVCLIAALSDHNPIFLIFLRQDFLVRILAMKHHDEKAIWEGLFSLLFNTAVHLKRCQDRNLNGAGT